MRILIVTAVELERNAVLRGLQTTHRYDVTVGGVGVVAAAVHTTMKLATTPYDLIINMGIAGGFNPYADIGSLVVADRVIWADLGAETPEGGFLSMDELGFGTMHVSLNSSLVVHARDTFLKAGIPTTMGPVLTVSTTTGTTETTKKLSSQIPGAVAEAMEGFGIASSAQAHGIPFMEIRAISNVVGPRNKKKWRMDEALKTLTTASSILSKEEFFRENYIFTLS